MARKICEIRFSNLFEFWTFLLTIDRSRSWSRTHFLPISVVFVDRFTSATQSNIGSNTSRMRAFSLFVQQWLTRCFRWDTPNSAFKAITLRHLYGHFSRYADTSSPSRNQSRYFRAIKCDYFRHDFFALIWYYFNPTTTVIEFCPSTRDNESTIHE